MSNANRLSGLKPTRSGNVIFIPLPVNDWRRIDDGCRCKVCRVGQTSGKESIAFWDTLAVSVTPGAHSDTTWMVHYPELHAEDVRMAARKKAEDSDLDIAVAKAGLEQERCTGVFCPHHLGANT